MSVRHVLSVRPTCSVFQLRIEVASLFTKRFLCSIAHLEKKNKIFQAWSIIYCWKMYFHRILHVSGLNCELVFILCPSDMLYFFKLLAEYLDHRSYWVCFGIVRVRSFRINKKNVWKKSMWLSRPNYVL